MKTSYCTFCGARAGEAHEPGCPRNNDITVTAGEGRQR